MDNPRISIFTGHFGSGKTEIAINFAINCKKYYNKVAIVDLDIVNPYFRTKDASRILESQGIKVIAPLFANTNVDIPALPAEILSLFHDKDYIAIFDVGGDEIGATALGRYHRYFLNEGYQMFLVINTKRPLTKDTESILSMFEGIKKNSRLEISGLINNTNLSYDSTVEDLIEGQKIIDDVSRQTMVPTRYITGKEKILSGMPEYMKKKAFPINLYLQMPWQ
ncbi:MAG: hypothetical protein GX066_06680 [Clostridiaceae bacterium]|nr:hypothetical protein [Clostridiaceae bacterium]